MKQEPKAFRVYENQLNLLIETDRKRDAITAMNNAHTTHPFRYHVLFEYWNGQYNGIKQYKPNDKIHQ